MPESQRNLAVVAIGLGRAVLAGLAHKRSADKADSETHPKAYQSGQHELNFVAGGSTSLDVNAAPFDPAQIPLSPIRASSAEPIGRSRLFPASSKRPSGRVTTWPPVYCPLKQTECRRR